MPEGKRLEVATSLADEIGVPAGVEIELAESTVAAGSDGDVPAPAPGRT